MESSNILERELTELEDRLVDGEIGNDSWVSGLSN